MPLPPNNRRRGREARLAPRAPGDGVCPQRLSGVVVWPLNFTVKGQSHAPREVRQLLKLLHKGVYGSHLDSSGDNQ